MGARVVVDFTTIAIRQILNHSFEAVMFENLLYEKREAIAIITVNRPTVRNALNSATVREIGIAFAQAKDDPAVGVVILTGAGEKAFVAGADINELEVQNPPGG